MIAFYEGQVIDGFTGAVPESHLKTFVDGLIEKVRGKPLSQDIEALLEQAEAAYHKGDLGGATAFYSQILQTAPSHSIAITGLASIRLAHGDIVQAKGLLSALPPEMLKEPVIAALSARIALIEEVAGKAKQRGKMEKKLKEEPDNHTLFCDGALACFDANDRDAAVSYLLEAIKKDREALDGRALKTYP